MASDTISDKNGDSLPPLPDRWKWATLEEVSSYPQYGWTTKAVENGSLLILRTTDITSGHIQWSRVPFCLDEPPDKDKYLLKDGDVVISRAGSVGFSHLVKSPPASVFASYLIRFRPAINERYFSFFLKCPAYWKAISENSVGIALQNVNASKLRRISIPVAPLEEQSRIVARIEELFTQLDAGVAALEKVQTQLRRYRQAVLKAAFEGQLTQKWREQHYGEISVASGSFQNNLVEKGDGLCLEDTLPPIPQEWIWTMFSSITKNCDGKRVPVKREDRKQIQGIFPYYGASGIIDHVNDFLFDGDYLLIGEDGANLVARSSPIAFQAKGKFWVNNHAHVVQTLYDMPLGYLEFYINSINLEKYVTGTAQPKMTQRAMNTIPVPLPSIDEQRLIVSDIERRFSIVERIEQTIATSLKQAESLRQNILKRAFEGKLVPQDPNDEPASTLLERIGAEIAKPEPEETRGKKVQTTSQRRLIPNGE